MPRGAARQPATDNRTVSCATARCDPNDGITKVSTRADLGPLVSSVLEDIVGEPNYLTNIPLEISVNGTTVTGFIDFVCATDLAVVITSHGAGRRNSTHVPHFAMYPVNWLARTEGEQTTITPRGQQRAERLLRELYEHPRLTQDDQGRRVEGEP